MTHTANNTELDRALAAVEALGDKPTVTSPVYVLRVEQPGGHGPLNARVPDEQALTPGRKLYELLRDEWNANTGRYPGFFEPRGREWDHRAAWWLRDDVRSSEWRCALDAPLCSYYGYGEREAQSVARSLDHWFGFDPVVRELLAEVGFGVSVIALPGYDQVQHGYSDQRIYHEPSADRRAHVKVPVGAGDWTGLASEVIAQLAAEKVAHRASCELAIVEWKRHRRNALARVRRVRAAAAAQQSLDVAA